MFLAPKPFSWMEQVIFMRVYTTNITKIVNFCGGVWNTFMKIHFHTFSWRFLMHFHENKKIHDVFLMPSPKIHYWNFDFLVVSFLSSPGHFGLERERERQWAESAVSPFFSLRAQAVLSLMHQGLPNWRGDGMFLFAPLKRTRSPRTVQLINLVVADMEY